jgi:hypothetical protein
MMITYPLCPVELATHESRRVLELGSQELEKNLELEKNQELERSLELVRSLGWRSQMPQHTNCYQDPLPL